MSFLKQLRMKAVLIGIVSALIFYYLRSAGQKKAIVVTDEGEQKVPSSAVSNSKEGRPDFNNTQYVMRHNPIRKVAVFVLLAILVMSFILSIVSLVQTGSETALAVFWVILFHLVFILLIGLLLVYYYDYKIVYDLEKIELINPFRKKVVLYWDDVDAIDILESGFFAVVKISGGGKTMKVNSTLIGFGHFKKFLFYMFPQDS